MSHPPQTYRNHARIVPLYHYGVFGILTINLGWWLYRLAGGVTGDAVVNLLVAVGLILIAFYAREMALRVQDRVIRLEMRLRLREVLPPELRARIPELTVRQLVALRFASDAELPGLVRETLDGRLGDGRDIKLRIKDWQADHLRA